MTPLRPRSAPRTPVACLPQRLPTLWRGQGIAVVATLAAALIRAFLDPLVDGTLPFITFFPAILVASVWGGRLAGLTAMGLASLIAGYFWLPRVWSLNLTLVSWVALVAFWLFGGMVIGVTVLLRALADARAESEARAIVMAEEMKHRVANILSVMLAVSHQTARGAATVQDYQAMLEARIGAMARAQALASGDTASPADLPALVARILEPFGDERVEMFGPPIPVAEDLGPTLALVLHELGTNAVKHGALSVPQGRVTVSWAAEENRTRLDWRERDGPAVSAPSRSGFGSRLLHSAFPPGKGDATLAFRPEGVECTIRFPGLAS